MNILHLNEAGSPVGGAEGYIADVSAALRKAGHSSHLVYFSPDDAGELIPVTTYAPLPEWPAPPLRAVEVLEQVVAEFHPDVAYVHLLYHPFLLRWIARRLPTVAYVHAPYLVCPGSAQYLRNSSQICPHTAGLVCLAKAQTERCCWGHNPLTHLRLLRRVRAFVEAYKEVKAILVGSRFMKQLLARGGIPFDKLSTLPPVLIREPLPPLTFAQHSRSILFAGRLVPEKGLRQLIQALARLEVDWQLVVAGDGPEREPCQALARELGVAGRVHFKGWLDGSQMDASLQASACVAVPSLWPEPFGRLGPEAFLHGRAVVASGVGGIVDWLDDGVTGFVVPPGDVVQLGHRIRTLLESPVLRAQMARNARAKVLDLWSVDRHVISLMRTFKQVRARSEEVYVGQAESMVDREAI
jgi:glycosyltransferase involved in cell wall biosynthesis